MAMVIAGAAFFAALAVVVAYRTDHKRALERGRMSAAAAIGVERRLASLFDEAEVVGLLRIGRPGAARLCAAHAGRGEPRLGHE